MILGIDEVGRGAWAGPLVVGAVVLGDAVIDGLADSKQLTKKKREELSGEVLEKAAGVGLGWVSAGEVDEIGLSEALRKATKEAVGQIKVPYHEIIIDGTVNFLADTNKGRYVTTLKKADQLIGAVSAAAIVAKVARDEYMGELDEAFVGYGFGSHVGYGTQKHRDAIENLGACAEHRLSFKPLRSYIDSTLYIACDTPDIAYVGATSKEMGDRAEQVVCEYLEKNGHEVVERNWKTKVCEIDIVSVLDGRVYFTEVKYRKSGRFGDGLEAITRTKLKRMSFAAEIYMNSGKVEADCCLAVASVSGDYVIEEFLVLSGAE